MFTILVVDLFRSHLVQCFHFYFFECLVQCFHYEVFYALVIFCANLEPHGDKFFFPVYGYFFASQFSCWIHWYSLQRSKFIGKCKFFILLVLLREYKCVLDLLYDCCILRTFSSLYHGRVFLSFFLSLSPLLCKSLRYLIWLCSFTKLFFVANGSCSTLVFLVKGLKILCYLDLQNGNIRNQRENVVLQLANAQSRLGIPVEANPVGILDI